MLRYPRRVWTWCSRRAKPDDQGFETSEVMLITAAGAVVVLGLMGRLGDILDRVVTHIDSLLPG